MKNLRSLVSSFLLYFVALFVTAGSLAVLFGADLSKAEAIGRDKYMHAGVSIALGAAARLQSPDPWKAWAIAMGPGLAKELYDARKGGTGFSVGDLVADGIGAYVGVKLGGLFFSRNRVSYTRSF